MQQTLDELCRRTPSTEELQTTRGYKIRPGDTIDSSEGDEVYQSEQRRPLKMWYLDKDHVRGISALEESKDVQADFALYLLRLEQHRTPIHHQGASENPKSVQSTNRTLDPSKLLESYVGTIHILHPILAEPRVMFERFNSHYSSTADGIDVALGDIMVSAENAVVLLMFALGEVCAYDGSLAATQDSKTFEADPTGHILPGMVYFSRAAAMLGMMIGEYTLAHAQAMILAALFLNQCARPVESAAWTSNACRVIEVLIQEYVDGVSESNLN
jgi:hypothetical protein